MTDIPKAIEYALRQCAPEYGLASADVDGFRARRTLQENTFTFLACVPGTENGVEEKLTLASARVGPGLVDAVREALARAARRLGVPRRDAGPAATEPRMEGLEPPTLCCGRPMNPMRAGTGTPPRASDELWCDTCGTTVPATHPVDQAIENLARKIHAAGGTPDRLPIGRSFSLAGRFRVYFNRHQAAPLVWCVRSENGNFELAVAQVDIAAPTRTVYRPKDTPDDEDGMPSAWLEVDGVVNVDINNPIVSITGPR